MDEDDEGHSGEAKQKKRSKIGGQKNGRKKKSPAVEGPDLPESKEFDEDVPLMKMTEV